MGTVVNVPIMRWSATEIIFTYITTSSVSGHTLSATNSSYMTALLTNGSVTDNSNTVVPSGYKMTVVKY